MRLLRVLSICALYALPLAALAQYSNQPYFNSSERIRYAHTLDLMGVRLDAMEAVVERQAVLPVDLVEQAANLLTDDLPRIAGSMALIDSERLATLREALEGVEEAATAGNAEILRQRIERARAAIATAREALLEGRSLDPPLAAVAMSRLLLGEPGVGEGYEEAVAGERWQYSLGWSALQRVKEIWTELSANLGGRSDEVQEALDELDELLPGPIPPENLSGDPEAGEEPSHRITSLLEGLTDTNLYPARELGRVVALTAYQATSACRAFEEGDENLGREMILAVQDAYESVSGTTAMLASEAHERVERALSAMTGGGEEEEDSGQIAPSADRAAACSELRLGLEEIAGLFGG